MPNSNDDFSIVQNKTLLLCCWLLEYAGCAAELWHNTGKICDSRAVQCFHTLYSYRLALATRSETSSVVFHLLHLFLFFRSCTWPAGIVIPLKAFRGKCGHTDENAHKCNAIKHDKTKPALAA